MHTVYFVCFGIGVGFSLISFILGEALGLLHIDSDFGPLSTLRPTVAAAFLISFGGCGLLLELIAGLPFYFILALALSFGFVVAMSINRFIITPLMNAENTSTVGILSLVGHPATVSESVPQGGFGKITYYINSNTYTAPAKSVDGNKINRHENVEIVYIEKNVYYIKMRGVSEPGEIELTKPVEADRRN